MRTFDTRVPAALRRRLRAIDDGTDPLEIALLVDEIFQPDLNLRVVRERLGDLGRIFARRLGSVGTTEQRFEQLGRFLGEECGFAGNEADYTHPDNSFLSRLLLSRRGLPITLSVLYVVVGRRAGLPVVGIGLPGHFVVGWLGNGPPLVLDPFRSGRRIPREACDRIVETVTEGKITRADRYLVPCKPRDLLTRILNNLEVSYWKRRENTLGLMTARLLCILSPEAPERVRTRAFFYDRLGRRAAALADYSSYLRRSPGAADAAVVRARVRHLTARLGGEHA